MRLKFTICCYLLLAFSAKAQTISTIAGDGISGYSGNGNLAISSKIDRPINVKVDRTGNIYVADDNNNVIRKINSSGVISTVAGNGYGAGTITTGGYTGDGGQATNAELWGPVDIAFDASGNLYIADNGNQVIRKVDMTSGIIKTVVGGGSSGIGDNGPATDAQLNDPVGIVFDNTGNMYFSDAGNYRVRKVSTTGIISTIAGTGVNGYNGDGIIATTAQLSIPQYLAINASGELYISDWTNQRVRKISSSGIITTVAGNGTPTNSGDGGLATAASVHGPDAIVFDDSGNFYISSIVTCVIRKVSTFGIISTVVGNDTCGYGGDGSPATSAKINQEAICSAVDKAGNLYIADSKNNRIRRVTYNSVGVKEPPVKESSTIFPNPAKENITVNIKDNIESISVINSIGQIVLQQSPSPHTSPSSRLTIDVATLPKGIYYVKVNGLYGGRFVKE